MRVRYWRLFPLSPLIASRLIARWVCFVFVAGVIAPLACCLIARWAFVAFVVCVLAPLASRLIARWFFVVCVVGRVWMVAGVGLVL